MWKIRSLTELDDHGRPLYWSNEFGWTWRDMGDVFTEEEHESFLLPIGGVWEAQIV